MTSLSAVTPTIDVDVVIIGGGIQGLWLLADLLDNGYQAILLERLRPGFGQTGHSHVFLHEGHMFASGPKERTQEIVARVTFVREANRLWKTALDTGRLATMNPLKSDFYMGWSDLQRADNFQVACRLANIPCEEVTNRPSEFGDLPMITKFYKSEGICLEAKALLDHLLNHNDLRNRVGYCKAIKVEKYDSERFDLVVDCATEDPLKVRAGAIVLSAGAGNERLVKRLFTTTGINLDTANTRQQTVKTFMLVIRDLKDSLKPAAGMFQEFGGIFVVSRQDPQGRTVLLVGDRQRELVQFPGDMTAFDATAWLQGMKMALQALLPDIVKNADNYEWGIYEATKAEALTVNDKFPDGGALPKNYQVYRHPDAPIWLTWPTLLTFAPKVSSEIVGQLKEVMPHSASFTDWSLWNNFCVSLSPSECRWKTTSLLGWSDFTRCFAS